MPPSSLKSRFGVFRLGLLLALAGQSWAEASDPGASRRADTAIAPVPELRLEPAEPAGSGAARRQNRLGPAMVPPPEPPPAACYRAARQRQGDPYVCDLAVQIARDSSSPPALAAALANRALVLAAEGRLEPALADLEAAVAATPGDPVLHGNRGNLLLRLGRPAEALAAHHRAVQLAPRDPRGYYNRAFSYLALGEPGEAEQEVETVRTLLERRPSPLSAADKPAQAGGRSR